MISCSVFNGFHCFYLRTKTGVHLTHSGHHQMDERNSNIISQITNWPVATTTISWRNVSYKNHQMSTYCIDSMSWFDSKGIVHKKFVQNFTENILWNQILYVRLRCHTQRSQTLLYGNLLLHFWFDHIFKKVTLDHLFF